MANAVYRYVGTQINVVAAKEIGYHEVVAIGDILGVAKNSGAKGDLIACEVEGVFELPKKVGVALEQGTLAYLVGEEVTKSGGPSAMPAGIVWEPAPAEATTVLVKLSV